MFATSFVLGYHGCDRRIGEGILRNKEHVAISKNRYDWLGEGAYFWENSPERALEMGRVSEEASDATEPAHRRAVCHWRDR
jgi:hypothetical protein